MVERQKPPAPESPQEGWVAELRGRISRLLGRKKSSADLQEEPKGTSREAYPPTPHLRQVLNSQVEINGVKMEFKWNEMWRTFSIVFPDLPSDRNFINIIDNGPLSIQIFKQAKNLAENGKSLQSVRGETEAFMLDFLRKHLTEDDGRRPFEDAKADFVG